jgi:hypothetical protein
MAVPQKIVKSPDLPAKASIAQPGLIIGAPRSNAPLGRHATSPPAERPSGPNRAFNDSDAITDRLDKLNVAAAEITMPPSSEGSSEIPATSSGAEDNHSHLSNSSTKPTSFDSKSIASENTYALDEKESLRPDDSASVQAAEEDESFFVPPTSGRLESQIGTEARNLNSRRSAQDGPVIMGNPARRFPLTTMANPPRFGEMVPNPVPAHAQGLAPATSFADSPQAAESLRQLSGGSTPPDEKLMEAMGTPKDRLLLLQLEERFLAFMAQPK